MSFEMMSISPSLVRKQAAAEIEKCNDFTIRLGLTLSHFDAVELVETRTISLAGNGRIEFGGGTIGKIIKEFFDSPYLSMDNYAETLNELTELFYYYKNETLDLMGDDDLIQFMKNSFNGKCGGSLQLLAERELANMARNLRFGYAPDDSEDPENREEDEDDEY